MKIAIFGGSFNPVHTEHVNIVRAAVSALNLDRVIIMPTSETPSKGGRLTASASDRLEMCRIAFKKVECAEVSGFETGRGGISYSYITCEEFAKKYPSDERYFILGADMLESFSKWKYPERILNAVTLAVCARADGESIKAPLENFKVRFNARAQVFGYVGKDVSSTKIRALLALGEPPDCLDNDVYNYIKGNNIYALPYAGAVKHMLTEQRWRHTVGVAVMAAENCSRLNIPESKALTAAVLHDCAKYLPADSQLLKGFECESGVPAQVVHQFAGAYIAEHAFNVTDEDVLNAIRYHTGGRIGMSALEKLIYLCDMLESGRSYPGVEELRALFAQDVDECLIAALKHNIDYLTRSGEKIYPLSIETYEYLKGIKNDK